jgi:hypothetical protein
MRRVNYILVILALVAATQIAGVNVNASPGRSASPQPLIQPQVQQGPQITSARLKGNKLIVTGENFGDGSVIFVNGEAVGTRSDPDNPSGILIAKKAGKKIAPDAMVVISVQNAVGLTSRAFDLFSGMVITFEDDGQTFGVAVGTKFQVVLQKNGYEWDAAAFDPAFINKLANEPLLPGSLGVFQTTKAGTTQISSFGELPCAKSTPPCLAPSLGFRVTLIVKDLN